MERIFTFLILLLIFRSYGQQEKTEVIVIGSIHQEVPNFNSETLYKILDQIKPDIILIEMDSSFFTKDFQFKFSSKENEQNATEK